ncbi:MAG: hypothetical protein NTV14_00355 [Coprothermobacterota bacterium]|nr:hypothetical protein [Coprothermobacterota bacterium]
MYPCCFRLEGNGQVEEGQGKLAVEEDGLLIIPSRGLPTSIPFSVLSGYEPPDPAGGSYGLTLRTPDLRLSLTEFGRQAGEASAAIRKAWQAAAQVGLFLAGMKGLGPFTGTFHWAGGKSRGEAILYPSLLLLFLEEGGVLAWPLRLWQEVRFDPSQYTVTIATLGGSLSCGQLAHRSEEFCRCAESALSDLKAQLVGLLRITLPDLSPTALLPLATILWQEMALPQNRIERALWDRLLVSFQSEERSPYLEALMKLSIPDQAWWGIAPVPAFREGDNPLTWLSVRLRASGTTGGPDPGDLLALEVVSVEEGYATYLFRLPPSAAAQDWIRQLHLTWPLVGFHREIISQPKSAIPNEKVFDWQTAFRCLPILRRMRENFLGKAAHLGSEEWKSQIETIRKNKRG